MAETRDDRRRERLPLVASVFAAEDVGVVLDLLEIAEFAWHDCYHEICPSEDIVDDILLLSGGRLDQMIEAVRLAITDWRDVRTNADRLRSDGV